MAAPAPDDAHLADRTLALAALRALIASLTSSARAIESATGLTNAQVFLLRLVSNHGPLSINELAELARIRQNGVSSVVGGLVRARLLKSERSRDDLRRVSLSLTPKGKRSLNRAPLPPAEMLITALDQLPAAEAAALARGLDALTTALHLDYVTAPMMFERARVRGR